MSEDGKTLSAFLKKGEESKVREIDKAGNVIRAYGMKNERVASQIIKNERKNMVKSKVRKREPKMETRR